MPEADPGGHRGLSARDRREVDERTTRVRCAKRAKLARGGHDGLSDGDLDRVLGRMDTWRRRRQGG